MADLTDGLVGLALSTLSIVILGEIVPQAACSRYGLYIGANTVWLVKIFIALMYILAWPISIILDIILGRDIGQVYSAAELHKLIRIHVENPDAQEESGLNKDDGNLLTGALEYKDKTVADVMTTLEKVFMLESQTRLTFQIMMEIYKSGFTRIPIYEIDRQNIVGILFTKDLILIDPDDGVEIAAVISFHGNREGGFVRGVPDDTSLDKVFREFKSSYLHLLIAYGEIPHSVQSRNVDEGSKVKDAHHIASRPEQHISDYTTAHSLTGNRRVVTGVITLEDVLEAVIKDEIVDETDNFIDVNKTETLVRGRGVDHRPDPTNFLTLFEHKIRGQTKLSDAETAAITAFLSLNVGEFKKLARFGRVLNKLIVASQVEERNTTDEVGELMKGPGTPPVLADEVVSDNPSDRRILPPGREARNMSQTISSGSSAVDSIDEEFDSADCGRSIYRKGHRCDFFVLILQGKVRVRAGADGFESELGPWCYIGQKALVTDTFIPDFRAVPHGPCRLLFIRRGDYNAALRAAHVEAISGSRSAADSRLADTAPSDCKLDGHTATGSLLVSEHKTTGR